LAAAPRGSELIDIGGVACLFAGNLDRAIDQLDRARPSFGLDPAAVTGEPAREIGLGGVAGLGQSGWVELVGHARPFSGPVERVG